jgi:Ribbon-helix-helix protein, copG family
MAKPFQVYLDKEDLDLLDTLAASRGWNKSQTVRVAIRALTKATEKEEDPLLGLSGMIDGLPEDLSENLHRYADEVCIVAERSRRYAPAKRRARARLHR